jgi:hypothetical protein
LKAEQIIPPRPAKGEQKSAGKKLKPFAKALFCLPQFLSFPRYNALRSGLDCQRRPTLVS